MPDSKFYPRLKCNRGSPCDTCLRRNKSSICQYAPNASRNKPGPSKSRNLKERLNNLENLVSSFLSSDTVIQPWTHDSETITPTTQPVERSTKSPSIVNSPGRGEELLTPETPHLREAGDGQVNYIDPSHWLSILEDIQEVREHLSILDNPISQNEARFNNFGVQSDATFLFGSNPSVNLAEVLSSLPSQAICDMLLSRYFNSQFMILGKIAFRYILNKIANLELHEAIIHPAKFQKEYEKFWEAPSKAPPLWIALLFSILSITVCLRQISNPISNPIESGESIPPARIFQQRTAQCLVLGRYATANTYALEAFLLHLQSCFLSHDNDDGDLWFEMGTIIRLAFRMGYHRDPSSLPGISPFDGEMRRRVWLHIFQIDALMSFHMGFPSMVPTEFCDTQVPRNLEYSDLYVDMTALPPARPLSEHTPVLYCIAKSGIMAMFKKIVAHTQSLSSPAYDKTIALDGEMREVYSLLPEVLKRRDVGRSFMDRSSLIMDRCTIELLYLKGLIVLHRRYVSYERQSPRFEPSRRACVEAALDILARQEDLHKASQPGGRLYEDRWMVSSLTVGDFILAAMVVCLDLSVRMRYSTIASTETNNDRDFTVRKYQALQTSQQIWAINSSISPKSHIVALAVDLMIKKVAENDAQRSPMYTAPMVDSEPLYVSPISQIIDGSESIDWGLFDQFFDNPNIEPSQLGSGNI
ncbi:hypothetical protein B7463_g4090, partial [Scytalidium lignicola]